ncbi:retrovirus-related pol polyprotein from transposon TNT 1-94 [Tanacetum coccineum]|uniref:Retrovirus-related pol polyprotein from transposon TNT 1-94 n=1 Tax=Tanacetum coccineum TaxID=301880 RepID=A0ABQ5IFD5_9ASTR
MEEYIRLEEEKDRRHGKVYKLVLLSYGKDLVRMKSFYDLRSVETEFPAIVFDDAFTSEVTPSYKPTVSPLNDNKIEFRISFDESDDEDYTSICLVFRHPCLGLLFDDLDFFKDFEKEFPAIVYNDALTSKSDFLTETTIIPQHIDEFNLKYETSLSKCEEENKTKFFDFPWAYDIEEDCLTWKILTLTDIIHTKWYTAVDSGDGVILQQDHIGNGEIRYCNEGNNMYLFSGIGLSTLLSGARIISDGMLQAATEW